MSAPGSPIGSGLLSDIRSAAHSLGRRPGWAVTAIATLALGLGGAIAVAARLEPAAVPAAE